MSQGESKHIDNTLNVANHFVQSKERSTSPTLASAPHLIMETPSPGASPSQISPSLKSSPIGCDNLDDFAFKDTDLETKEVDKTASGKAPADPKTELKRRSWKKPADRPKRPLSAYNLFFQFARERIVNGNTSWDITAEDVDKIGRGARSGNRKKRRHRKTHGKIGFQDLARIIAAKWKVLNPAQRTLFEQRAKIEKKQYLQVMAEWNLEQATKQEVQMQSKPQINFSLVPKLPLSLRSDTDTMTTSLGQENYQHSNQLGGPNGVHLQDMTLELQPTEEEDRQRLENELRFLQMENSQAARTLGPPMPRNDYFMEGQALPMSQGISHTMPTTQIVDFRGQSCFAPPGTSMQPPAGYSFIQTPSVSAPQLTSGLYAMQAPVSSQQMNIAMGTSMAPGQYHDTGFSADLDYYKMANQVYDAAQVTLPQGYVPYSPSTNGGTVPFSMIEPRQHMNFRPMESVALPTPTAFQTQHTVQRMAGTTNPPGAAASNQAFRPVFLPGEPVSLVNPSENLETDSLLMETVMLPSPQKRRSRKTKRTAVPTSGNDLAESGAGQAVAMDAHQGLASPTYEDTHTTEEDLEGIKAILDSM